MGRFRFSLTYKLILLLVLSLFVQLALFVQYCLLETETEQVISSAIRDKKVSEAINRLENYLSDTPRLLHGSQLSASAFSDPSFLSAMQGAAEQLEELKELTADDAKFSSIVDSSREAFEQYKQALREVRSKSNSGVSNSESGHDALKERALNSLTNVLSDQLVSAGKNSKQLADASLEKQATLRQTQRQFLRSGLLAIVLLTVVFAWLMISRISRRLGILNENIALLPSGAPMKVVPGGGDEIAELSKMFFSMVEQLKAASAKERNIVENARDLICSIDSRGNFVEVNGAALDILDYCADDLRGTQFADLVDVRSINHTLDALDLVRKEGTGSFETQLISNDGRAIDTLWTAYWAASESQIYCVIHDISARRELDRIKQNIALMSTHDLRSPLTAIDNYFEMLKLGSFVDLSEEGRDALKQSTNSAARMKALIDDFLDLEKIDSGMMPVEMENIEVSKLLQDCRDAAEDITGERVFAVEIEENNDLYIYADENLVRKALLKVLLFASDRISRTSRTSRTNYTGQQAKVIMAAQSFEKDSVVISIAIDKFDISDEELDALFRRFKFAGNDEGGQSSLLGLYVCKTFVEHCVGSASINRDKHDGLVFNLKFQPRRDQK